MKRKTAAPIELGSKRQLFLDEMFLAKRKRITLEVNPPVQDTEPVLVAERPWERLGLGAYNTVTREGDVFRMWYDVTSREKSRLLRRLLCYAESGDGVHWTKPKLGLIAFNGSKANNIVAPPSRHASQQGATVFRDDRAPADERYKLWTKYQASKEDNAKGISTGLWAMVSPDGLRWKLLEDGYPLGRGTASDSQNICLWDEDLGKYVGFVRMKNRPKNRGRTCWAGITFSDDFRTWTRAREILRADRVDGRSPVPQGRCECRPIMDFYTPGGMKIPGVPDAYILLPTPYHHWRQDAFPSTIDVRLATSRDRTTWWQHPDRRPFLRLGPDGSASAGMIFANPWPIPVGDEIWLYYAGIGSDHRRKGPSPSLTGLFRARIRRDGFVCARAGHQGGQFTTPPVRFSGRRLELNVDGSAGGWLRVEILTPEGRPVRSYGLNQCDTVRGNSVRKVVTWNEQDDVSRLANKPIRLRFVMRSMDLFAFQFKG